jgi:hypothetical protein
MAIRWLDAVLNNSQARLGDRLVLLVLADSADNDTGSCYPGIPTIARKAGMSERAVQYSIKRLEELGELTVTRQSTKFGTNTYALSGKLLGVKQLHRGGADFAPLPVQILHPGGEAVAPKPSVEPLEEPSVEPNTNGVTKSETRRAPDYSAEFEAFWAQTHRRGVKMNASAEWNRLTPADHDAIMAALPKWRASEDWNREPKYIMHIERWLKYRHFDDEPTPMVRTTANGHGSRPGPGETWADVFAREQRAAHMPVDDKKGDEPW